MQKRNIQGQFENTTGNTIYKKKMWNSKPIDEHRRKLLQAIGLKENLPRKWIIHHIDNNKKNNDINNLTLMTIIAHNRIHTHVPWNKGIKSVNNEKWANTIKKAQKNRKKTFLRQWKKWWIMRKKKMTYIEISNKIGKCRETISAGVKKYEKYIRTGEDL